MEGGRIFALMSYILRAATPSDCQAIYDLIVELAIFELEPNGVIITPETFLRDGFGDVPLFKCWVAEASGTVVGLALCYIRYSTWKGPTLYLEDLIVTQSARGQGIGSALFDMCIVQAAAMGCYGLIWEVLDWNTPAINFYERKGATKQPGWLKMTLKGSD